MAIVRDWPDEIDGAFVLREGTVLLYVYPRRDAGQTGPMQNWSTKADALERRKKKNVIIIIIIYKKIHMNGNQLNRVPNSLRYRADFLQRIPTHEV